MITVIAAKMPMSRRLWAIVTLSLALTLSGPINAQEREFRANVELRVGEIHRLGIFGGHKLDCVTSTPPTSIQVIQPPRLGALSQREGVPYTARHSLGGTCIGARFLGTEVDYTARATGSDTVVLDIGYLNGHERRIASITVMP